MADGDPLIIGATNHGGIGLTKLLLGLTGLYIEFPAAGSGTVLTVVSRDLVGAYPVISAFGGDGIVVSGRAESGFGVGGSSSTGVGVSGATPRTLGVPGFLGC
jgi:hypothetical protein